jgi:hypothetical protein
VVNEEKIRGDNTAKDKHSNASSDISTSARKKELSGKTIAMIASAAVVVIAIIVVAFIIFRPNSAPNVISNFTSGIANSDFTNVYNSFSDGLKSEVSAASFEMAAASYGLDHSCGFKLNSKTTANETTTYNGRIKCDGGKTFTAVFKINDDGKISSYSIAREEK